MLNLLLRCYCVPSQYNIINIILLCTVAWINLHSCKVNKKNLRDYTIIKIVNTLTVNLNLMEQFYKQWLSLTN